MLSSILLVKGQDENLIFFWEPKFRKKKKIPPYLRIRNILKFKAI